MLKNCVEQLGGKIGNFCEKIGWKGMLKNCAENFCGKILWEIVWKVVLKILVVKV